jgi:hypothetical protein
MPPSGKYSPRIAPVDAMVTNFSGKNRVVALWKSLFEASIKKARNGPSTQLIKATICIERSNNMIKAEEQN